MTKEVGEMAAPKPTKKVVRKPTPAAKKAEPVATNGGEQEALEFEEAEEAEELEGAEPVAVAVDESHAFSEDDEYDEYEESEEEAKALDHELSFEDILNADDLAEVQFEVPEWGGFVVLKPLTHERISHLRKTTRTEDGSLDYELFMDKVLMAGLVKPPVNKNELQLLRSKNAGVIFRLQEQITRISGMDDDEVARRKAERRFPRRRR